MILIPYAVDVPSDRRPFMNWLIIAGIIAVFSFQIYSVWRLMQESKQGRVAPAEHGTPQQPSQSPKDEELFEGTPRDELPFERFILHGWDVRGLFGHMWLHAGFIHIIGNLIFLWVFGNAVCAKVGNIFYLPMYIFFGLAAATAHNLFFGGAALGASGAINGVVGMFLVFFPENEISCLWIFWFPLMIRPIIKTFSVSSYWMILLWFVFDLGGLIMGGGGVAHMAHLGGFAAGFILGVFLVERKWVRMERYEKSFLELVGLVKRQVEPEARPDWEPWQRDFEAVEAASEPAPIPFDTAEPETTTPQQAPIPPPVAEPVSAQAPVPKGEQIRFTCSCGKRFTVPAKFAGRMGRCPRCKNAIKIPAAGTGAQQQATQTGGAPDSFLRFSCSCGKRFKVPREYAGRMARCPECNRAIEIPNA